MVHNHLWYIISTIRSFIKYIFIIDLVIGDINVEIIYYILGQTWATLTGFNLIVVSFLKRVSKRMVWGARYIDPEKFVHGFVTTIEHLANMLQSII